MQGTSCVSEPLFLAVHVLLRSCLPPGLSFWQHMLYQTIVGSTVIYGPEVYEDRDPVQREAEGPRASMDYSEFPLLDFSPPKNTISIVPEFGPDASRIARRSHARVRERPLQSAVGTLLLHTHYVHAKARCHSPKRQLLAFRCRSSSRDHAHALQGVLGQRVLDLRVAEFALGIQPST